MFVATTPISRCLPRLPGDIRCPLPVTLWNERSKGPVRQVPRYRFEQRRSSVHRAHSSGRAGRHWVGPYDLGHALLPRHGHVHGSIHRGRCLGRVRARRRWLPDLDGLLLRFFCGGSGACSKDAAWSSRGHSSAVAKRGTNSHRPPRATRRHHASKRLGGHRGCQRYRHSLEQRTRGNHHTHWPRGRCKQRCPERCLTMADSVMHVGAMVLCAHGGAAFPTGADPRVRMSGQPVVTTSTRFAISACPGAPACVSGRFTAGAQRVFASGIPVVLSTSPSVSQPEPLALRVVATQPRVKSV